MNADTEIVIPEIEIDRGVITSAYGPEDAGDLSDIVDQPPETDDEAPAQDPSA